MAAPTVSVRKDEDGGHSLVAKVDGVEVAFATVNPSQLAEAAFAQGVTLPKAKGEGDGEGEG